MDVLPADAPHPAPAIAADAVPHSADPPELLDVEMQQAVGPRPLMDRDRGLERAQPRQPLVRTVRSLTPTPAATAAGGSCWVRTRATIWPRLRGVVGLLVCGDGRLATTTVAELAWINNLLAVQS